MNIIQKIITFGTLKQIRTWEIYYKEPYTAVYLP